MREITDCLELNRKVSAHVMVDGAITEHIEQKARILEYLKSFESDAVCASVVYDSVKKEHTSIAIEEFDDGEFCWDSSVIYYFENYDIKLAPEFISKAVKEI